MINDELASIIQKLHIRQPNMNPPLTSEQIQSFEAALECKIPSEIAQLYLDHDGDAPLGYFPMFLMTSVEAIKTYNEIKRKESWWYIFPTLTDQIRYLWHDGDGNFAGIYVDGLLLGKITFYNHEDPDPAPVFRSVLSFYSGTLRALDNHQGWSDMPTDYPVFGDITPADAASDLAIAVYCMEQERNEDFFRSHGWASCVVALMPPAETGRLIPLMGYRYNNSKILGTFAKRRFAPAISGITQRLYHEVELAYSRPIHTLGEIGTDEAGRTLVEFMQTTTRKMAFWIVFELKKCGYQIREIDGGYEYLAPDDDTWHKL